MAVYAVFYLVTAFALGYGTTSLGYSRESFLIVQLAAIPFLAIGIVWSGYWSDARTPRGVIMTGCALMIPAGLLLAPMLGSGSLIVIWVFLSLALLLMGLAYGPVGAFIPSLFPARVRYTGASMALNVGGILGGAVTPAWRKRWPRGRPARRFVTARGGADWPGGADSAGTQSDSLTKAREKPAIFLPEYDV